MGTRGTGTAVAPVFAQAQSAAAPDAANCNSGAEAFSVPYMIIDSYIGCKDAASEWLVSIRQIV